MIESGITPEHVQIAVHALGLTGLAMAFSHRQKEWFRDRDDHVCQAHRLNIPHNCNGHPDMPRSQRKLQIHHIIPQRYAAVIGMETADFAENGITLCEAFHQREVHPDMKEALDTYRRGDKGSFKRVGTDRDALLSQGVIYWNDRHDRRLSTRAIQKTQRYRRPFPRK